MAKAKKNAPTVGKNWTIQGFVGRLRDYDLKDEDGVVIDYAYAFGIQTKHGYMDVSLFDDAKGWVEGEIFNAETGKFRRVDALRNGDYIRVSGRYSEKDWTDGEKSGTNLRLKVSFPGQIQKLKKPGKRTKRVSFDGNTARQEAPDKPDTPSAV